jgi:D-alanine-D-alanine ligase
MKIGLAVTLKSPGSDVGRPDDWQEEFDSPATIAGLRTALESNGHIVVELGDGRALIEHLLRDPPDLVFNIAEGTGVGRSREARVPAVCEMLGVPYTGSDPLTLAVGLDKDVARRLVAAAGAPVPKGFVVTSKQPYDATAVPYPAIIKPAWEGSSKGIRGKCIVHSPSELAERLPVVLRDYEQPVLVEEFIAGDEFTVGVLGNDPPRVLGAMHVIPRKPTTEFVYSLEVKRDWENQVRYEFAQPSSASALDMNALAAYRALGCRDIARIDFRIRDGVPYFLEANPLPGLNAETGDIVLIARAMKVSHKRLVNSVVESAVQRLGLSQLH